MKLEILFQFIVPLMFLAIWALTSLLNRDAQPLPPRPGRPNEPGGFRPGERAQGRGESRTSAASTASGRPATAASGSGGGFGNEGPSRWSAPPRAGTERAAAGRPANLDDAIVFIETEPRTQGPRRTSAELSSPSQSGSGLKGQRGMQSRRSGRGRAGGGASASRSSTPPVQRALSEMVTESLARQKSKPLEITPLSAPLAPLASSLSQATPAAEVTQTKSTKSHPTLSSGDVRAILATPGKLREIALFTELMQPPLAMRRPRHHR